MHREPRAGRLAEGEGGAGVVDVVMGEDHPVDVVRTDPLFLGEAEHGSKASGVAGIDDGRALRSPIEIGLRASNPRDRSDHMVMIGAHTLITKRYLSGVASCTTL